MSQIPHCCCDDPCHRETTARHYDLDSPPRSSSRPLEEAPVIWHLDQPDFVVEWWALGLLEAWAEGSARASKFNHNDQSG